MSRTLTLRRILAAPRAAVWDCWTTPELLCRWFAPTPNQLLHAVIELRPGGRFFTEMEVNGARHAGEGMVLTVEPGRRLVFTDLMESDFLPAAAPGLGFTADIALADHAGGTDYRVAARHRSEEEAARHEEMGFSIGWGIAADQLEALAAGL